MMNVVAYRISTTTSRSSIAIQSGTLTRDHVIDTKLGWYGIITMNLPYRNIHH